MTVTPEFQRAHDDWHASRMDKLTANNGWLNLVGRWWITPGTLSIGAAAANDIQLDRGPEVLGRLTLNPDDTGRFEPVDGEPITLDRNAGAFSWQADRFLMEITALNDLRALRVRDMTADMSAAEDLFDSFPLNPSLRITARWEPLPEPMDLTLDTIIGIPTQVPVTHVARFEFAGRQMALLPTYGTADRPQFVFRDLTSMDDTYAKARFVFGEDVTDTSVVIDFNRATNPPCAFTEHAVCPLPPRENLFPVRIEAGERRVRS
ncbi:DUF1684 domain-containing protein [Pseudoruegeria sp. SK021]|uniref:DUF1684 domain-containing protein n=1 Tax=Pseudoruegeria sp. SK021 TaxID=1933035 RepID=UPI000A218B89|nr:DUF1684 domain-containing protein [Pseudoruegeria sp. SK021]OSP54814.1 hypothetical protein BV911_10875 [Pseudoruegeria sp. SK021]